MKSELVFATNNAHKLQEVQEMLGHAFTIRSLKEIGCYEELPETHDTLEENAFEKARYIREHYGYDCFADDTGLEVAALDGAPGVYSARYAGIDETDYINGNNRWGQQGDSHDSEANMRKLLANLEGKNRTARFRTVVALIYQGKEYQFEGIVDGAIATEKHGGEGFGYDPIFMPDDMGGELTFAEMSSADKNRISHRGRAMQKLKDFFK